MLHDKRRLLLIAGPCSLESEANCRTVATELKALAARHPELNIIFKGSYDKANRTSLGGDRGLHERLFLSWKEGRPAALFTDEIRQPVEVSNLSLIHI